MPPQHRVKTPPGAPTNSSAGLGEPRRSKVGAAPVRTSAEAGLSSIAMSTSPKYDLPTARFAKQASGAKLSRRSQNARSERPRGGYGY
jgi:hypothetical protein